MSGKSAIRRALSVTAIALLAGCAPGADLSRLTGCYQLVNGPPVRLDVRVDGTATIGMGNDQREIAWSFENDQILLELPGRFFRLLSAAIRPAAHPQAHAGGYFGLTPGCGGFDRCRLGLGPDGRVYFKALPRAGGRCGVS